VRRLSPASVYLPEDLGSEVVSGLNNGSGEYFVRVGVGSVAADGAVDSGSDVIWVQCRSCEQSDPVTSSPFSGVSYGSAICRKLPCSGCGDSIGRVPLRGVVRGQVV
jgi:hypothetical protein